MDEEKLIVEVSKYPELYNPLLSQYKDMPRRENIWDEIAQTLKPTGTYLCMYLLVF